MGTFLAGHDRRTSLRVGMSLSQVGEFSFIIAALGLSLGVTSEFLYPIAVAVSAVTTFSTPYLLRSSDKLAGWFERAAPAPVARWLDLYSSWVSELGERKASFAFQLVRKWAWQIGLNLILVAGIFIAASALRGWGAERWPAFPGGEDGIKAALWLAAMLVTLPLLIAVVRKLRAHALLLAEISVTKPRAVRTRPVLRALVANTISSPARSRSCSSFSCSARRFFLPGNCWSPLPRRWSSPRPRCCLRRAFVKLYLPGAICFANHPQPTAAPSSSACAARPAVDFAGSWPNDRATAAR